METAVILSVTIGFAALWIGTYKPGRFRGYLCHTALFAVLAVIVSIIMTFAVFSRVDDSYSASNIGALGLMMRIYLSVFAFACIIAVLGSLGKYFGHRDGGKGKTLRRYAIIASVTLFLAEGGIWFTSGWVRGYVGDILVVPLIYAVLRWVSPIRPGFGYKLPSAVLLLAFAVEFLQLLGAADFLGITSDILRQLIGTSFSVIDLLCYTVGAIPLYILENSGFISNVS